MNTLNVTGVTIQCDAINDDSASENAQSLIDAINEEIRDFQGQPQIIGREAAFFTTDEEFPEVPAEAYSDDRHIEVEFDAGEYFAQIGPDEALALEQTDWGGSEWRDEIARYYGNRDTKSLFDYLSQDPTNFGNPVGFECSVDRRDAYRCMAQTNPKALKAILKWAKQEDYSIDIGIKLSDL